jgi:hypothetical protein
VNSLDEAGTVEWLSRTGMGSRDGLGYAHRTLFLS